MRRSNCILFACALAWRRGAKRRRDRRKNPDLKRPRGYLVLRWSDWGPFPHVLFARESTCGRLRLVSYKPAAPRRRWLPPPLFTGRVRWGDG